MTAGDREFQVAGLFSNVGASEQQIVSWGALLWTLPLGIVWRWSCSLELMAFLLLITLSSHVSRRGLEGEVRPIGRCLGWCRCTASQLVYLCHVFNP